MSFEVLLQLVLACVFGLLIGLDRQVKHKPLGLKTCTIICTASCLLTIVSIQSFYAHATEVFNTMDPMRLAAQIVSGVGFIGAGVILRRSNDVISGLTSAAVIWAASGLGITVGAGFYWEAAVALALVLLSINFVPLLVKRIGPSALRMRDVSVKIVMDPNYRMTELLRVLERKSEGKPVIKIRHMKITDLENQRQQIDLKLAAPEDQYTTEIYYLIKKIDDVITVEVEHL
ncbi:MgtC/SapB family protein [Alteribacter natronophilus]|uniref:MgtC/SapB family protein n=1 Tax=Alteribacter natronophilus TaxID=2583810 RepID=UPI00110E136F|nr:MgtC/SapB family protein [Alteribacter natronophilus]TMW70474.1 MgtC/SapB family protein [Alteribacter natronophilus]